MFGKQKKDQRPKTDQEVLLEALGELEKDEARREQMRHRKRRGKLLLPAWLEGRLFIGLAVILVIVIGDAVRRENQEFVATLTSYSGSVTVQQNEDAAPTAPVANQKLVDDMVVTTGANSYATIEFPDGSVTTLDQNTVLVIKLMEYSRGGRWRTRSFFLTAGRMWSNVSPNFGEKSQMKVYTPSAVAAVRGTQYAVVYDPQKKVTAIQCNDGYVTSEGFTGEPSWVGQGGQTLVGYGLPPAEPQYMTPADQATFAQEPLNRPVQPESWIKQAELTLTQILDAPLSILGVGKCSWAVGSADFARRSAALTALRYIMQFLEGYATYPEFVNPATLEELNIPYKEAKRILWNFDGEALIKYEPMGGRSYRITVRARDKRRTMFILTPVGIEQVKEEG